MRTALRNYTIAAITLTGLLTAVFEFGAADRSFPGLGLFLLLETPGMILRPDQWLFHHTGLTGLVTSGLAVLVWLLPVFGCHALARAIGKALSRPAV